MTPERPTIRVCNDHGSYTVSYFGWSDGCPACDEVARLKALQRGKLTRCDTETTRWMLKTNADTITNLGKLIDEQQAEITELKREAEMRQANYLLAAGLLVDEQKRDECQAALIASYESSIASSETTFRRHLRVIREQANLIADLKEKIDKLTLDCEEQRGPEVSPLNWGGPKA